MLGALPASGAADGFGPLTLSFTVLRVTGSVSRLGLILAAQATAALALTLAGGVGRRPGRIRPPRRPGLAIAVLMPVMTAEALALGLGVVAAAAVGAHAFLTASAVVMAVAGTAFGFLPALWSETRGSR